MRLYNSIDSLCNSYSIPISEKTIGYLQFFSEIMIASSTDIVSMKYSIVDASTGNEASIKPLNAVAQYLGDNTFRILLQGFYNIPELFNFRFKIVVTTETQTVTLYSDVFSYMKCSNSYPIIPCLVGTEQYSSYGAFMGEIKDNIVFQSWHTNEPKKYTPVVFLRHVSFNKKTSTIEYKKLNNKPLKSTLKKTYNLICEPVSSIYSEYIMDIFGFGKVNLLGETYAFDTYSDEILDEKDCCSLYKITATAYKETKLRIACSNNCVVLDPIDCDDFDGFEFTCSLPLNVSVTSSDNSIVINATNTNNEVYRIRWGKTINGIYSTANTSTFPFIINNVSMNTDYTIEIHNYCGEKLTYTIYNDSYKIFDNTFDNTFE